MMKTEHQQRVEQFMLAAKQDVPEQPTLPSTEIRKLRAKLILEEALETIAALGFSPQVQSLDEYEDAVWKDIDMEEIDFVPRYGANLIDIADGCADLSVVTIGTLSACGIKDKHLLEEVDGNNLDKIATGTLRNDGKLVKSKDHKPPRIKEILWEQGHAI